MCLNKIELVHQRSVVRKVALGDEQAGDDVRGGSARTVPHTCRLIRAVSNRDSVEQRIRTSKMLIQNQLEILLELDRRRWPCQ